MTVTALPMSDGWWR